MARKQSPGISKILGLAYPNWAASAAGKEAAEDRDNWAHPQTY